MMQSPWQHFLLENGATLDSSGLLSFGNDRAALARLHSGTLIASLDQLGCIRASGADAESFLQGQLSNDIKQLQAQQVQFSAYCNPKGRMLAHFLIMPDSSDFLLFLPRSLLAATLKRLRMFVLRSQVSLEDVSDTTVCLGLAGSALNQLSTLPDLPQTDYALQTVNNSLLCKLPGPVSRYLLVGDIEEARRVWQAALADGATAASHHLWQWLDIQAGLPLILPETTEAFVPQMVNLELIDAVNFKKGCYPGQEIVARMHYLGKPKRRMHHFTLETSELPAPGTDIFVANEDGQSAGKVVLAEIGEQMIDCLAVIQNDKQDKELRAGAPDGPKLTMAKLPYPVESA